MSEPAWVTIARADIGTQEVPGKQTAPAITRWLIGLNAWWRDDETPWCGVFVAHCMREAGIARPKSWFRALGWLEWGVTLKDPVPGCVVIYQRTGGGHVGFLLGENAHGSYMTLGGNQGNSVSIVPIDPLRAVGYRWPVAVPVPTEKLPLLASNGQPVSNNEA